MIVYVAKHIKSARRSGLALMTARWALNYFERETSFYTTPICCHQGSPLSPRQRYVWQQSDQADNQGFWKRWLSPFLLSFLHKRWQSPFKLSSPCKKHWFDVFCHGISEYYW